MNANTPGEYNHRKIDLPCIEGGSLSMAVRLLDSPLRHLLIPRLLQASDIMRLRSQVTAVMLLGCFLSSCSTTTPVSVQLAPNANWVKIHSNPPTWYPRGTPANGPVDHHAGEWIYTEDSNDNRFFIPFHGLSAERRKTLLAEALAARNPEKLKTINREETNRRIATGVGFVIVAPILALGSGG